MNCIYCHNDISFVKTKNVFSQIKVQECPNCKHWYYTPETREYAVNKFLQKIKFAIFFFSLNLIYVIWSVLNGSFDSNNFEDLFNCTSSFVATIIVLFLGIKKYLAASSADWLEYEE